MAVGGIKRATLIAVLFLAASELQTAQGRTLFMMAPAPAPMMMAAEGPTYFKQPALPFPYTQEEPYIDTRTMEIHYTKHMAGYYANLNKAIVPFPALQGLSLVDVLMALNTSAIPTNVSKAVRNNAGGAWNHLLYFKTLQAANVTTNNSVVPSPLSEAIDSTFGNLTAFKAKFNESALAVFGSGWTWLTVNPQNGSLAIESTPNQDNPMSSTLSYSGNIPVMGIDVWEHAYYLKHANLRAAYIADWWKVVSWPAVNANYQAAKQGDKITITAYQAS